MIVIYYQSIKEKATFYTELPRIEYSIDCLKEFRFHFNKLYYSWLGVK